MTAPFGCRLNYGQLLRNLRACGFTVTKLVSANDIETASESCGDFYEVTRREGEAEWYVHVEVYSEKLPVLPGVLRSYAVQLNVSEDRLVDPKVN